MRTGTESVNSCVQQLSQTIVIPNRDNADVSYTNKYQSHIACSYGYNVVCFDDKYSKPVQKYCGRTSGKNSEIQ